MHCQFLKSAAKPSDLPPEGLPEVAFIGRSNVGKSSLINAITGTQSLARKSREPGRTRLANFFSLNEEILLVDLPGYGFAKVTEEERFKWQILIDGYLLRKAVARYIFLFDPRRDLEDLDYAVLRILPKSVAVLVVLTKCDKISKAEVAKRTKSLMLELGKTKLNIEDIVAISNLKKTGIDDLRKTLLKRNH